VVASGGENDLRLIDWARVNEEELQVAYEILQYLIDNPNAQDTIEGIVQWWLKEGTLQRQSVAVGEALSKLVAADLVLARAGKDKQTRYKLNGRQRAKIISLLCTRDKKDHTAE
jgi:hypothetical protein